MEAAEGRAADVSLHVCRDLLLFPLPQWAICIHRVFWGRGQEGLCNLTLTLKITDNREELLVNERYKSFRAN